MRADVAAARALALGCDVVVESFRPGWLAARGLGAVELRAAKPSLIYLSISGFGQSGPYAQRPGYGNVAEAMSGLRYITGEADGPPMRVGISIGDEIAGLYAVAAVLAALRARDRDGSGETIDLSLLESIFSVLEGTLPEYVHTGRVTRRSGNQLKSLAPSNVYPTRDGEWLAVGGNGQGIFRRLMAAIGRPELADDPRFATNQARREHVDELDRIIADWTQQVDAGTAEARLAEAGVPVGPVLSVAQIVEHPQFVARGAIARARDDDGSEVATYGPVTRFAEHALATNRAAGAVGRDQAEALRTFGLAPSNARNAASSMTGTPSDSALASFDPGSSPATT